MPLYTALDSLVSYLNKETNDASFLSLSFQALRDKEKNLLTSKDLVLKHLKEIREGISNLRIEREDSHFLLYFDFENKEYIAKVRFDQNELIDSITEEIYHPDLKMMVLIVEYDGSHYFGMQKQNGMEEDTIQTEIEKALKNMLNKDVVVYSASRTDRGVHALGQVVHFDSFGIAPKNYLSALNTFLPKDIRIKDAFTRSQLFNSRYDVIMKTYQYVIDMGEYSVFEKDHVAYYKVNNIARIREELKCLIGSHDFTSFCKGENDDTVRTIYDASLHLKGNRIILTFTGDGFLHNMIRFVVGSLMEIDRTGVGSLEVIMDAKDRTLTPHLAPASGLYLMSIKY